ncbi:MAG: type II secretion system protein [Sideroxyarcus sp.]|nr:type II secretion system protein [Sideroxyarcus sp.]
MKYIKPTQNRAAGFTLVEIAIVLLIVTLLMTGLVPSISSQIEQGRRNEAGKYMNEVRDALVGYALANKFLPCPDTDNDGYANACATPAIGKLPYKDLGVTAKDAHGATLEYGVTNAFADSGTPFTLATPGAIKICTTSLSCSGATALTETAVAVIVSRGANWSTPPLGDELENANSDVKFVSHDITSGFDDQVIWISPNILFNRMVAAGQLP